MQTKKGSYLRFTIYRSINFIGLLIYSLILNLPHWRTSPFQMSTMGALLRLALAATLCYVVYSKMTIIDTPEELKTCFDQPRFNTKETDPRLDNIHQYCIQKFRWHLQNNNPNITHETTHWIDELLRMANKEARKKRQAGAERRRKEIRRATDKERTDFFRAINLLKRDTVSYFMYDICLGSAINF